MAVIPELEELTKSANMKKDWTDDEKDTLLRYYNKVPVEDLMRYLPGRSEGAIRVRVSMLKNQKITPEVDKV
jgi:hypothetical protein